MTLQIILGTLLIRNWNTFTTVKSDTTHDCKTIKVATFLQWSLSADINECELETYPCHFNANCVDTDGSFNCTCREGFEGNGVNCTGRLTIIKKDSIHVWWWFLNFVADIPECGREIDDCDPNATCTNTVGSYVCNCNAGFTGDGFTCIG